jgi:hypothetical protein
VPIASVAAVVAIAGALVGVKLTSAPPAGGESVASAAVVRQITTVPAGLARVNGGRPAAMLQAVRTPGRPLAIGGKPELTLRTTELADNSGRPLQAQTPLDRRPIGTYDVPPYVHSADQSGAVPFLDIGNYYILAGAQYSPQILTACPPARSPASSTTPPAPWPRPSTAQPGRSSPPSTRSCTTRQPTASPKGQIHQLKVPAATAASAPAIPALWKRSPVSCH